MNVNILMNLLIWNIHEQINTPKFVMQYITQYERGMVEMTLTNGRWREKQEIQFCRNIKVTCF